MNAVTARPISESDSCSRPSTCRSESCVGHYPSRSTRYAYAAWQSTTSPATQTTTSPTEARRLSVRGSDCKVSRRAQSPEHEIFVAAFMAARLRPTANSSNPWPWPPSDQLATREPLAASSRTARGTPTVAGSPRLRASRPAASTRSFRQAIVQREGGHTSAARTGPRIRPSAARAVPQSSVAAPGGRNLAHDMICLFRCPASHRLSLRHIEHSLRR